MSHQVVTVKREAVAPCMTCPLCHKLFRDATTIIECLHTFCRKCIYKKLSDEEMENCPICNIDLGGVPLEKLRADHNLQDVRSKIFPSKRIKMKLPEVVSPIALPAKRKERSLSSLVVSTPRVSATGGMTGRRSKSNSRKASKGASFTIEKLLKKEDDSADDLDENSSSPEMENTNMRQNSGSSDPCKLSVADSRKENGSRAWDPNVDVWKPLNCLVEVANRSKSSKFSFQGSACKPEAHHAQDNEGVVGKVKNREHKQKSKVHDEKKDHIDHSTNTEVEKPMKLRKIRLKKPRKFGDFQFPPQDVLDTKFNHRSYPIWFSLVSDEQVADARPLPQLSASYLRIKDGSLPVSFIQKYVKMKLQLSNDDEVEIKCMGRTLIPTLTLNNLLDLWLQTTISGRVSATVGSSAKDFVMVLGYSRRTP
ncbi:hypothetical protein M569_06878, partial [Genlisea aurea]